MISWLIAYNARRVDTLNRRIHDYEVNRAKRRELEQRLAAVQRNDTQLSPHSSKHQAVLPAASSSRVTQRSNTERKPSTIKVDVIEAICEVLELFSHESKPKTARLLQFHLTKYLCAEPHKRSQQRLCRDLAQLVTQHRNEQEQLKEAERGRNHEGPTL